MSPRDNGQPRIFKTPGDWISLAGLVALFISLWFPWMRVWLDVGMFDFREEVVTIDLFRIPWYWVALLFLVLAAVVVFFFYPKTRGAVTMGAGIFYVLFNVVFFIGAWYKINAIIGDITRIVRSVPIVGELLETLFIEITKRILDVRLGAGYYIFLAAGVLFIVGGALRMWAGRRGSDTPQE